MEGKHFRGWTGGYSAPSHRAQSGKWTADPPSGYAHGTEPTNPRGTARSGRATVLVDRRGGRLAAAARACGTRAVGVYPNCASPDAQRRHPRPARAESLSACERAGLCCRLPEGPDQAPEDRYRGPGPSWPRTQTAASTTLPSPFCAPRCLRFSVDFSTGSSHSWTREDCRLRRVSTTEQSCEMQFPERDYAVRRGLEIVGEYVDTGRSGAKASQPELDRLMRDARMRRFDAVMVWQLDRWGRSVAHCIRSVQELASLGVRFLVIRERVVCGIRNARINGKSWGVPSGCSGGRGHGDGR